ncbi:MAG: aldo/keto reductase [Treponema sp.]|nr:aldo/keto reductase [Treponema sp.]
MKKTIFIIFTLVVCVSALTACRVTQTDPEIVVGVFDMERKVVLLNNGIEMPILGLGTWLLSPEQTENSVYHALAAGVRLIDTANVYMNERAVGRGIRMSGVPREEVFIITKLWITSYDNAAEEIEETLARLDVDYIDLLLLHQPFGSYLTAWKVMENAVNEGKVRSIGLSNFYEEKFSAIMEIATIPPAVLQVESNPFFHQTVMREFIRPFGTVLNSWFPLGGQGNTHILFENEIIAEIAEAHGKTPAQVILRWHLQVGNVAIPGSSNPNHIRENFDIFGFELTEEEMQRIETLDRGYGVLEFTEELGEIFSSWTFDFNDQE